MSFPSSFRSASSNLLTSSCPVISSPTHRRHCGKSSYSFLVVLFHHLHMSVLDVRNLSRPRILDAHACSSSNTYPPRGSCTSSQTPCLFRIGSFLVLRSLFLEQPQGEIIPVLPTPRRDILVHLWMGFQILATGVPVGFLNVAVPRRFRQRLLRLCNSRAFILNRLAVLCLA